jgi:hypothetical protein
VVDRHWQCPLEFHLPRYAILTGQPDVHLNRHPAPSSITAAPGLSSTIGIKTGTSSTSISAGTSTMGIDPRADRTSSSSAGRIYGQQHQR